MKCSADDALLALEIAVVVVFAGAFAVIVTEFAKMAVR